MNKLVDDFVANANKWALEYSILRQIILETELTEDFKWGVPCYTLSNKNVVLIHGFKNYCAILFIKGALINDHSSILVQQTQNVQAGRQIRFTSSLEINARKEQILDYIKQAIEIEKSGQTITLKSTSEYKIVSEFESVLKSDKAIETAFHALLPGKQREYLLYFSQAKQSRTRLQRIEKCVPLILKGLGLKQK